MELMQILHNSLHCSQSVLQCVSGSAWKAIVVQVTFNLLIFDLEHRIPIHGFHANLHHRLRGSPKRGVTNGASISERQIEATAHPGYAYHISATFPS